MKNFQDKLVVVFGGGRDIGAAISVEMARQGANVALTYYDSEPDTIQKAVTAVGSAPFTQKVDALNAEEVSSFIEASSKHFGKKISVLVNVVGGIVGRKRMDEMDEKFWELVFNLNTKCIFTATKAALPLFEDGGAIVNLASQAARDGGGPGSIAYAAAKGAIMTMTRGLVKELGPRRIRVNAVCPGMISTRFHDEFTKPEVRQRVAGMTPLGREGRAEEVADLVAYLASEKASFVNGTNVDINGGILFS